MLNKLLNKNFRKIRSDADCCAMLRPNVVRTQVKGRYAEKYKQEINRGYNQMIHSPVILNY